MKPPAFEYIAVSTLDEAIGLLAEDHEAKILAGGQSLLPLLNMRLARPSALVDLRKVAGLNRIEVLDGSVKIGAMVRQREAELSPELADAIPLLREALRHVAHPQIRAQGTIGGSLAHADPAAELPAVVLLLGGVLHAVGANGERRIEARDFFQSYFMTSLAPDEVLLAVELPRPAQPVGWACQELARRRGDFPLCGAAVQVELGDDGAVREARVALFGVAERPVRAVAAETLLAGRSPEPELVAEAARAAVADLSPVGDVHATPAFRRHLAEVVTRRTLAEAIDRGRH